MKKDRQAQYTPEGYPQRPAFERAARKVLSEEASAVEKVEKHLRAVQDAITRARNAEKRRRGVRRSADYGGHAMRHLVAALTALLCACGPEPRDLNPCNMVLVGSADLEGFSIAQERTREAMKRVFGWGFDACPHMAGSLVFVETPEGVKKRCNNENAAACSFPWSLPQAMVLRSGFASMPHEALHNLEYKFFKIVDYEHSGSRWAELEKWRRGAALLKEALR